MNYFPFHIGDYAVHTRHLTLMEDLAYRRLLDLYYTRETPLPNDEQEVARLVGMREHVAEVNGVLQEFFDNEGDGWFHARCDDEIARMRAKQAEQEVKEAHESERMRRHRERRSQMFAALRAAGVVPAWDLPIKELQRLHATHCNAPETDLQRGQNAPATAISTNTNTNTNTNTIREAIASPGSPKARPAKRCPPTFLLSPEALSAMRAECPGLDIEREGLKFRDWEFKTARSDWLAAWRTWMRKAFENRAAQPTGETNYARSMREKYEEVAPRIAARAPGIRPNPLEVIEGMAREQRLITG